MELDELKSAWADLGRRLDEQERLTRTLRLEAWLDKAKTRVARFGFTPALDIAGDLVALLLLGSYAGTGHPAKFEIPAISMVVFTVIKLVSEIWQLTTLFTIDYSHTVLEIQQKLCQVRAVRLRTIQWVFILAPLIWMPLMLVGFNGLTGADLYKLCGTKYILSNYIFGIAAIPILIAVGRALRKRQSTSRVVRFMADEFGGRGLAEAIGTVNEVARFDKESQ